MSHCHDNTAAIIAQLRAEIAQLRAENAALRLRGPNTRTETVSMAVPPSLQEIVNNINVSFTYPVPNPPCPPSPCRPRCRSRSNSPHRVYN